MKNSIDLIGSTHQNLEIKTRILGVISYFGLAPFLWFFHPLQRKYDFFKHHLFHSLALSFMTLCLNMMQVIPFLLLIFVFGFDFQYAFDTRAGGYGAFQLTQGWFSGVLSILALTLNAIWWICVIGALLGRTWHLPVISRIASTNWMTSLVVVSSLLMYLVYLVLFGVVVDSVKIASAARQQADVYILYEEGGYLPVPGLYETYTPPSWAVTAAFYPLVRAGMEKFGDDRVSILPLSEATFNQAVQQGRFIFVVSHGGYTPGTFATSFAPFQEYGPWNVPPGFAENQLEFVYFAGCEAGRLETEWRSALGMEDAIMFNRISYITEHMLWIWFESPAVIAQLGN